jgi:hypothetical protein
VSRVVSKKIGDYIVQKKLNIYSINKKADNSRDYRSPRTCFQYRLREYRYMGRPFMKGP